MFNCIKDKIRYLVCQRNYAKILKRIKFKKKLKVIFLVTENQKWGYQSLYETLEQHELFEPLIVVAVLEGVHKGKDKTRLNLEENYNFFKSGGMNVDYAYKNGEYVDLKDFAPDIVFYEQPWGLPKKYRPCNVSKYALTCYSDYGFELFCNPDNYKNNFHALLYKFFVEHEKNIERYTQYTKKACMNCIALGYPKLDVYFRKQVQEHTCLWREENKFKIIYAPHHSFDEGGLKLATFKTNGEFILNLAKKYQGITTWIFKPHPQFKYALLKNKIMSEQQIEHYFKEWEKLGNIYERGAYFKIFNTSDLLITDCSSFLGEYLPSKKPIIQLVNPEHREFNPLGKKITSQNYKAYSCEEVNKYFEELVINKNDFLSEKRLELIKSVIDFNKPSATKICEYLTETLLEKEHHD